MFYLPFPVGRVCRKCVTWKPYCLLKKHKKMRDGVDTICLQCHQALEVPRYYANFERIAAQRKGYYRRERGRILAKHQERREAIKITMKQWRTRNQPHIKHYDQQRYLENPGSVLVKNHRRRARKRNLPHTFTEADWTRALEYFGHRCAICGKPPGLWHKLAMDHWIPLASPSCPGTIPGNILPLCHGLDGCNNFKQDKDPAEWTIATLGEKAGKAKLREIEAYFASLETRAK